MSAAQQFLDLFSPYSPKSYGEYREGASSPARTIKDFAGIDAAQSHIDGDVGIGLVPLHGDQCGWAVIDIDNHGDEGDVDLLSLAAKFNDYPGTVVTRSKSGGAHIYFFFRDPVLGKDARSLVHQVAMATELAGNEIFPKQNQIREDGWGNWINLPYFGGDKSNRYGVAPGGERMPLADFLATKPATPAEIEAAIESATIGAPPCIEHLLREPPAQGHRNMALFSLAVFFKRSTPHIWQDKTQEYALSRMDPPLPLQEAKNVIRSVGRTDYTYRCTEAPLIDICNKERCLLAKHGLTAEQLNQQGEPVDVGSLIKYLTEPPVWDLNTELGPVRLTTKALLSHSLVREAIAERYLKIIPKLKTDEWHSVLSGLMAEATIVDVPDDASPSGLVWNALMEYTSVAMADDAADEGHNEAKWEAGLPIKMEDQILFSGSKFIAWLRRAKRAEGMAPSAIYMALKTKQLDQVRLRIGSSVKRSWAVPVAMMNKAYPAFVPEEEDF